MIVVDASAVVEALVGRNAPEAIMQALTGEVAAPTVLDIEVLSALRGLTLGGVLPLEAAESARHNYFDLAIARYEVKPLSDRIWQLRRQYTAYGAAYLALAEALDVPLWTCDRKLTAGAHQAQVVVLASALE